MGYDVLQEHFELTLPSDLNVTNDAARQKEIADSARAFYFQDKPITKESHREIGEVIIRTSSSDSSFNHVIWIMDFQLLSDVMFGYGTQFSLTMMSAMRSSPIYEYLFTYEGPIGVLKDLQLINPADGGKCWKVIDTKVGQFCTPWCNRRSVNRCPSHGRLVLLILHECLQTTAITRLLGGESCSFYD